MGTSRDILWRREKGQIPAGHVFQTDVVKSRTRAKREPQDFGIKIKNI